MKKLLMLAMLATSVSGYAIAQDSGSGSGNNTSGSDTSSTSAGDGMEGSEGTSPGGGGSTSDSTNAENAPFLGNRDVIGSFFSDEGMTTMRSGDEFTSAYEALTDEQRAAITTECQQADDSQRPFCDAFTASGTN